MWKKKLRLVNARALSFACSINLYYMVVDFLGNSSTDETRIKCNLFGTQDGTTPLFAAVENNKQDVVSLLLHSKANANVVRVRFFYQPVLV